jgi:hypothetical protein
LTFVIFLELRHLSWIVWIIPIHCSYHLNTR